MTHTIENKARLLARVRRIKGQMEAVERALEASAGCAEVLQLVASVRGATNGLMTELVEEHLDQHVVHAATDDERHKGAAELMNVVRTYLK